MRFLPIFLLITASLGSREGFAIEWKGRGGSSEIEDRRNGEGFTAIPDGTELANSIEVVVKVGDAIRNRIWGKEPGCVKLQKQLGGITQVGDKLKPNKEPFSMLPSPNLTKTLKKKAAALGSASNACAGAFANQMLVFKTAQAEIDASMVKLESVYEKPAEVSRKLVANYKKWSYPDCPNGDLKQKNVVKALDDFSNAYLDLQAYLGSTKSELGLSMDSLQISINKCASK